MSRSRVTSLLALLVLGAVVFVLTPEHQAARQSHSGTMESLAVTIPSANAKVAASVGGKYAPGGSMIAVAASTFRSFFGQKNLENVIKHYVRSTANISKQAPAPAPAPGPSPGTASAPEPVSKPAGMVFDGDRMVGVNAVFDKSNIFVISLNNTLGRKRLLASGQRLATKGIKDFHVMSGINGNAPPKSAERWTLASYITGRSSNPLLADSRCCCWNGVRFADGQPNGKGNYVLSSAEGACFVSHMRVWELLLKSNNDWAMVFEDDASLASSFPTAINGTLTLPPFPADAEIIMLNDDGYAPYVPKAGKTKALTYSMVGLPTTGFEGYAISKKAAARILDTANQVIPLTRPLDWLVLQLGLPFASRERSMRKGESKTAYENFLLMTYRSIPTVVYTSDASRATSEIGKYSGEVKGKISRFCNKSQDSPLGALS